MIKRTRYWEIIYRYLAPVQVTCCWQLSSQQPTVRLEHVTAAGNMKWRDTPLRHQSQPNIVVDDDRVASNGTVERCPIIKYRCYRVQYEPLSDFSFFLLQNFLWFFIYLLRTPAVMLKLFRCHKIVVGRPVRCKYVYLSFTWTHFSN